MTDTLTAESAAQVFQEARRWEESLAQRTEGITWMVWGTVTPALLMTLGFVTTQDLPAWAVVVSWTPWVLVGYALTYAIWRMAALSRPGDVQPPGVGAYVVKTLALVGLVLVLHFAVRPETLAGPMALIGIGWTAAGILTRRVSPLGKRIGVAIGLLVFLAALLLETFSPSMTATMLGGTAILGLVPITLGLYQALRG